MTMAATSTHARAMAIFLTFLLFLNTGLLLSYICFFGLGGILATRMLRMLWASTRPLRLML